MMRVSKKCILIGDIYEYKDKIKKEYKYKSTDLQHLCIQKKTFENIDEISSKKYKYKICNFNNSGNTRYNCLLHINKNL